MNEYQKWQKWTNSGTHGAGGSGRWNERQAAREMFEEIFGDASGHSTGTGAPAREPLQSLFVIQEKETGAQALERIKAQVGQVMNVAKEQGWRGKHECQVFGRETLHRYEFQQTRGVMHVIGHWEINPARALVRVADELSDALLG